MPHAGAEAGRYVDALNQAMTAHGINTPAQRAAFLAQIAVESDDLRSVAEGLNYSSTQNIRKNWPGRFRTEAEAVPYLHHPEALANRAYARKNGNNDEASGDGFRFRGRGLIQITGRGLYREVGAENNPESLAEPQNAANSAAIYWQNRRLNDRTTGVLNRAQFNAVTHTINTAELKSQERWEAYQRALIVFSGK